MNELHEQVAAALEELRLPIVIHDHSSFELPVLSPNDVSRTLGISLGRITKSVLLQQQSGTRFVLAVCPIDRRIDMASISRHLGLGRLEVAVEASVSKKCGYQRLGVSPLGLPRDVVVVIDTSLMAYPTVVVGGGNVGIEVELSPWDLAEACNAQIVEITDG